jgi:hypothetical protein
VVLPEARSTGDVGGSDLGHFAAIGGVVKSRGFGSAWTPPPSLVVAQESWAWDAAERGAFLDD